MIYLNTGLFKPILMIFSVLLLPLSFSCCILTFTDFRIELFFISLIMILLYFVIIIGGYKHSKTKKNYLFIENDFIVINYYNLRCAKINVQDIKKIEYYKISSIKAWGMLFNCVCPQCAYITYIYDEKEVCEHIGYPDFNRISKLCDSIGVNFSIK